LKIMELAQVSFALAGTSGSCVPAAFLTYVVYDKNYVQKYFGSKAVTENGNMVKEHLVQTPLVIDEPGYIYICVYNRSDNVNLVYFDDLNVSVSHSPIVAGADYYPFGLPMEGREVTQEDYRWGYQGQYAEKDTATGWNQFQLRMYDARFGRWLSVDPYGQYASPYLAMGNTPNSSIDPDGGYELPAVTIRALSMRTISTIASAAISAMSVVGSARSCCPDPPGYKDRRGKVQGPTGDLGKVDPNQPSSEQLRRWNSPTLETNFELPPSQFTLSAKTPSWLENWASSTGIIGSVSYNVANELYLASFFFTKPFLGEHRNLDGTIPTQREKEIGAISGAMTVLPMTPKGYKLKKVIGDKFVVFTKTKPATNLPGQARAVLTWVKTIHGRTVRFFKDSYRIDGRPYGPRKHKYPKFE
jgi:RHS repeat-associated protein